MPEPRGWWPVILLVTPLCFGFDFAADVTSMEAWRLARPNPGIMSPGMRAAEYLLLLPFLILACRAATQIGYRRPYTGLRILAQLTMCLAFCALARPAVVAAAWLTGNRELASELAQALVDPSIESMAQWIASTAAMAMNYLFCVGVVAGVKTYRDLESERILRSESQRQATQARLQALTNQLNPHFLFNALNTIVALIGTEPRLAQTMISRISDLLRRILNDGTTQFVSLDRELELAENYLEIQEMRFPQRLSHQFSISASAATALVPSLILQPLIENAVVHGLQHDDSIVSVSIDACVDNETLSLRITNSGALQRGPLSMSQGVGLRNVTERLETLYAGKASVERSHVGSTFTVALRIPYLTVVSAPHEAPLAAVSGAMV